MASAGKAFSAFTKQKSWLVGGVLVLLAVLGGVLMPHTLPETAEKPVKPTVATAIADPASTTEAMTYRPPTMPEVASPQKLFLRLGLATVLVLGVCFLMLLIAKRWMRPLGLQQDGMQQLQLLETLPLGGRCAVHLLQAGHCKVLVGMDSSGLKALVTLLEPFDKALVDAQQEEAEKLPQLAGLPMPREEERLEPVRRCA